MKRILLASLFSICLALLVATTFLLINPFPVFAATGSANCGDGTAIQCSMDGSATICRKKLLTKKGVIMRPSLKFLANEKNR